MKSPRFSIVIDPEFQSLVPPMSADSLAQLEQNIREHGLQQKIIVLDTPDGFAILDGHHRFEIMKRVAAEGLVDFNRDVPAFQISNNPDRWGLTNNEYFETGPFYRDTDRETVKLWILQNQVGRRNLTLEERTAMVAKIVVLRQRISADISKANLKQGTESPEPRGTQIASVGKTVRAAAKEFGVPQRPLQAAVNAAKGKPAPAKTAKPKPPKPPTEATGRFHKVRHDEVTTQCPRCGEQVPTTSIKKHNQDNHKTDSEFLLGPFDTIPDTARETFYIIRRKSDGALMGEMGFYGRDWEPFTALRMAHISEKELGTAKDDLTQRYKLLNDDDYELIQVQATYRLTVVPAQPETQLLAAEVAA